MEPKKITSKMHGKNVGSAASAKATQVIDRTRHTAREITTPLVRAADKTTHKAIDGAEEAASKAEHRGQEWVNR